MKFNSIGSALEEIKNGRCIIVVDNEDRENEGDLVSASELVTPDMVNFMAKEGRGLICVTIDSKKARSLNLEPMERKNSSLYKLKIG